MAIQQVRRTATSIPIAPVIPVTPEVPETPVAASPMLPSYASPLVGQNADSVQQRIADMLASTDTTEADFNAASANLGSGLAGSGFGQNRQLILRDSERNQRLKDAATLLDPYLQREADSARLAITEAGLDRRLGQEMANQLQLAMIRGDQDRALELLRQAGASDLQRNQIRGEMERTRLTVGANLAGDVIRSGGGGGGGAGRVAPQGTNSIGTGGGGTMPGWASSVAGVSPGNASSQNLFGAPMAYNPAARPGTNPAASGGNQLSGIRSIDRLLASFGLTGGNVSQYF